ncbi:MAG TPA: multicopper oxidase domain-containing protein [Actinomycetaceae bacterium]|nr:multicopper oxidase domain-containing protein [Actinomycetaceae bacterium]
MLLGAVAVVVGVAVVATLAWLGVIGRATVDTVGTVRFDQPLHVPPLAESRLDDAGRRVFDLTAQQGTRQFVPGGATTPTWGLNGDYLGPTLRAHRGEEVVVRITNELPETTTMHWHGMHLPPEMDGGPHQTVAPGETWSPSWVVDQPAATLWYHPHTHGLTQEHVGRGLAGMFILDDDTSGTLDLPSEYGVDDIPVIVQDRSIDDEGRVTGSSFGTTGPLGEELLVNGTYGPYLDVTTERVRLRLLNASAARTYAFAADDGRDLMLVGTDGGLLEAPVPMDQVQLSPGERAEVVVTMSPGERVVLRSLPPDLGTDGTEDRSAGGQDRFDVLELRAADEPAPSPPLPERLVPVPRLDPAADAHRTFDLRSFRINGRSMDMDRVDLAVTVDSTEVWEVRNVHGTPHNFHVHDVQFQVLDVDGAPPPPQLRGWKDTVYLPPHGSVRLIMRFEDYTDATVPYMFHCHLLWHEDQGMMGQFVVVDEGEEPDLAGAGDGEHHH